MLRHEATPGFAAALGDDRAAEILAELRAELQARTSGGASICLPRLPELLQNLFDARGLVTRGHRRAAAGTVRRRGHRTAGGA